MQGSGFRVQGSGFRVQGSGFRVHGSGFRVAPAGEEKVSEHLEEVGVVGVALNCP